MNWSDNIGRRELWHYVNKKINRVILSSHVYSVITILFDEMIKDLDAGKEIKIHNFGTFSLQETKPRRHYNFLTKKIEISKPHRVMKFNLAHRIRRKLLSLLDLEKTVISRENHEE
jgi:nucleoid DNA-binding protein